MNIKSKTKQNTSMAFGTSSVLVAALFVVFLVMADCRILPEEHISSPPSRQGYLPISGIVQPSAMWRPTCDYGNTLVFYRYVTNYFRQTCLNLKYRPANETAPIEEAYSFPISNMDVYGIGLKAVDPTNKVISETDKILIADQ